MRKALLLGLPVVIACVAVAVIFYPFSRDEPPKGKVLQKLEDHFAGPWGWIEDYEGREWLVIGRGRVRVPYDRQTLGVATDGYMAKRVRELAGDVPFPCIYRINSENEIDCVWRVEDGERLYGKP